MIATRHLPLLACLALFAPSGLTAAAAGALRAGGGAGVPAAPPLPEGAPAHAAGQDSADESRSETGGDTSDGGTADDSGGDGGDGPAGAAADAPDDDTGGQEDAPLDP